MFKKLTKALGNLFSSRKSNGRQDVEHSVEEDGDTLQIDILPQSTSNCEHSKTSGAQHVPHSVEVAKDVLLQYGDHTLPLSSSNCEHAQHSDENHWRKDDAIDESIHGKHVAGRLKSPSSNSSFRGKDCSLSAGRLDVHHGNGNTTGKSKEITSAVLSAKKQNVNFENVTPSTNRREVLGKFPPLNKESKANKGLCERETSCKDGADIRNPINDEKKENVSLSLTEVEKWANDVQTTHKSVSRCQKDNPLQTKKTVELFSANALPGNSIVECDVLSSSDILSTKLRENGIEKEQDIPVKISGSLPMHEIPRSAEQLDGTGKTIESSSCRTTESDDAFKSVKGVKGRPEDIRQDLYHEVQESTISSDKVFKQAFENISFITKGDDIKVLGTQTQPLSNHGFLIKGDDEIITKVCFNNPYLECLSTNVTLQDSREVEKQHQSKTVQDHREVERQHQSKTILDCRDVERQHQIKAVHDQSLDESKCFDRPITKLSDVISDQPILQPNDTANFQSKESQYGHTAKEDVTQDLLIKSQLSKSKHRSNANEDFVSASVGSGTGNEVVNVELSACFKPVDYPRSVSCLYEQTGEIVTLSNWQFIRTLIEGSSKATYVDIRKNIRFDLGVGCQFMWDGSTPIPLPCIADGTEVKFDAVRVEGRRTFQALVIWKGRKPKHVAHKLTKDSFICQSSFDVICNDLFTHDGIKYISGYCDQKKIVAEIQNDVIYINCSEKESKNLKSILNKKSIHAWVSKLICGNKETGFIYVCSHIWQGTRSELEGFKIGRIYKRYTSGTLVADENSDCLHCDVDGLLSKFGADCVVKFEIDRKMVSLSLPMKDVYFGNRIFSGPVPLDAPVQVHVLERSNFDCTIVHIQVIGNQSCFDICKLPTPEKHAIPSTNEFDNRSDVVLSDQSLLKGSPFIDNSTYDEDKVQGPVFLDNYVGKFYTESDKQYIRADIEGYVDSVYIAIETLEILDTELECLVMWHGDIPVPLSGVTDGSKVKFDAIWVPKMNRFQAVVIWKYKKPSAVFQVTKDTYMCIESTQVMCTDLSSEDGVNYIHGLYKGAMICAAVLNRCVYVNGKQVKFEQLRIAHESNSNSTYARISKVMKGQRGTPFLHVCTCVWSAVRPIEENVLDRGMVYMMGPKDTICIDKTCPILHCDEIINARATNKDYLLEYKTSSSNDDNGFLPIMTKDFDFEGSAPIIIKAKTHIVRRSQHPPFALHVQLLEKFTFDNDHTSDLSISGKHSCSQAKERCTDLDMKASEETSKVIGMNFESYEKSQVNHNFLINSIIPSRENDVHPINSKDKSYGNCAPKMSIPEGNGLLSTVLNIKKISVPEGSCLPSEKQNFTNCELEAQGDRGKSPSTVFRNECKEPFENPKPVIEVSSQLQIPAQLEVDCYFQKLEKMAERDETITKFKDINCLYNQEGEICTFSNKRYIKTSIEGYINPIYVGIGIKSSRIGNQLLWQEKKPIILSSVADGSSVKFDAIWLEDGKRFQALVIWQGSKPKFIRDLTNKSYLCMESKDIQCTNLSTENGVFSMDCYFEGKKISVPIHNGTIYVNGKQSVFEILAAAHALNPENTHGQVTCLLNGKNGGSFKYFCHCVWSGIKPEKENIFKIGEVYAHRADDFMLVESYCLHCDLPCLVTRKGQKLALEFQVEGKKIALPLLTKDIYFGNCKPTIYVPDGMNVKAHILELSKNDWDVLLVQLTRYPSACEDMNSKVSILESEYSHSLDKDFAHQKLASTYQGDIRPLPEPTTTLEMSSDIGCLYNKDGEVFKLLNKIYIKTSVQGFCQILYVNTERRDWSATRIGCRFLWHGQSPVPLSDVPDGTTVKFDAMWMPDNKNFQALVIWNDNKPRCVREPSHMSYLCLDSHRVVCTDIFTLTDNMNYITSYSNDIEISAFVPSNVVFINDSQGTFQALRSDHLSGKTVYAQISKCVSGIKNLDVRYFCSCLWLEDALDKNVIFFEIGNIYKEESKQSFVIDENSMCLYCDLICHLRILKPNPVLELEVENCKCLIPISAEAIYWGNCKWDSEVPPNTPLTVHIIKLSKSDWCFLYAQLLVNSQTLLSSESNKFTNDKQSYLGEKSQVLNVQREASPILNDINKSYSKDCKLKSTRWLHNHCGELCTLDGEFYIKTTIEDCHNFIYVDTKRRQIINACVGCSVLWQGHIPIPLSSVTNGSKVWFDAILMSDMQTFQALVIWRYSKPTYVLEPSSDSYLWIENRDVICTDMKYSDRIELIYTYYDEQKVYATAVNGAMYLDGKETDFETLKTIHASNSQPIHAIVSKFMRGKKDAPFRYVCSCLWSGLKPKETEVFERRKLYKPGPKCSVIFSNNSGGLYCDLPCQVKRTELGSFLAFEIENVEFSLHIVTENFLTWINVHDCILHPDSWTKAHILQISKSKWFVLYVQSPDNAMVDGSLSSKIIASSNHFSSKEKGLPNLNSKKNTTTVKDNNPTQEIGVPSANIHGEVGHLAQSFENLCVNDCISSQQSIYVEQCSNKERSDFPILDREIKTSLFHDGTDSSEHYQQGEASEILVAYNKTIDSTEISSSFNKITVSEDVSCLYNQNGEMCTLGKEKVIRSVIQGNSKLVYVKVKKVGMFGAVVGCSILWRGNTPIPLSELPDGSHVTFDAVWIADKKMFQAIIIWAVRKPDCIALPYNNSYLWVSSCSLVCSGFSRKNGIDYVCVYFDQGNILAEVMSKAGFIDGEAATFADMKSLHGHDAVVYARVSKLMTGNEEGEFRYVCTCIWSGNPISNGLFFKKGEIYKAGPNCTFVTERNPILLFCDLPCTAERKASHNVIEFEVEGNKVSVPLPMKNIHFGNHRVECVEPPTNMKAHIMRMSKSRWIILHVQLLSKPAFGGSLYSNTLVQNNSSLEREKTYDQRTVICKNSGAQANAKCKEINSVKVGIKSTSEFKGKRDYAKCYYPRFLLDATGVLSCVIGSYMILKIQNKKFIEPGGVFAFIHKSVAFVGGWPFYKDMPFDDQVADLISETWHCSLNKKAMVIQGMELTYEAILAWQGHKPTENDIEFFKRAPPDSEFFYSTNYKMEEQLETMRFFNGNYNSNHDGLDKELNNLSSYAINCLSAEDVELHNDIELFPTIAADEDKEIIELTNNVSTTEEQQ